MKTLQVGLARELITPWRGIPLVGYFNPRPNTGIFDDLSVKAVLFQQGKELFGFVNFDLCFVSLELIADIRKQLVKKGFDFGDKLVFHATHTHTGPFITKLFGGPVDKSYLKYLTNQAVQAIVNAQKSLSPAELCIADKVNNQQAYNRRYYMKNGKVLTNPGKLNPDIVKPEGPRDDQISVIAIRQDGKFSALLVNIVNHTDTIGGNFVSADWPGRMEKKIQMALGYDLPVVTMIGCSGNINHFDVASDCDQTEYKEAVRIGFAYAENVLDILKNVKPVEVDQLKLKKATLNIPFRSFDKAIVAEAKATVVRIGSVSTDEDMTSEGLATGDGPVAKFFAEQLVEYARSHSGKSRDFDYYYLQLGKDIAFATLPGEPFVEIGLDIKKRMNAKSKFIVTLAQGACGYVAMPECFDRGGYEILPVCDGGPPSDTAPRIQKLFAKLIDQK